MVEEAKR